MRTWLRRVPYIVGILLITIAASPIPRRAGDDPNPPVETVKLIFIHHSTGENWLTDGYGNLGLTLQQNNYFVSDTNYGWGPDGIGDRTDIPHWTEWFASADTPTYMSALFNESERHSSYTRTLSNPGGENEIIMFKSCFPNSALAGGPNDPPDPDGWLTVGHAKYVYNTILQYFATRPDKLFIVITAPPLSDGTYADNARAFNQWLMNNWLSENDYSLNNVAIFDFYNVLTGPDANHLYNTVSGQIEHILGSQNTLYYPFGDDHPSVLGSQKATEEFVPLLNIFYHRWKGSVPGAFDKSTPADGATGQTATPTLHWSTSSGAAAYQYCYYKSGEDPCSAWINNGAHTSVTLSGLSNGTYYWHVRAVNGNKITYSNGSETAFWSFNVLDLIRPTVTSITRADPDPSGAPSVDFTVAFSEPVTDVDAGDFALHVTGTVSGVTIGAVTGSGTSRTVTVHVGSGIGTLRLDVPVGATIYDLSSNLIEGLPFTSGQFYTISSMWYIRGQGSFAYGTPDDIPVPADYNGDGKAEIAVFRPSNSTWYIRGIGSFVYGTATDTPVPTDYNGDGRDEIAVFRSSNGTWYIRGIGSVVYGMAGDIPVPADYNGDGKADIAVFRPTNSTWYIRGMGPSVYGMVGDIPVPADYNGDGKADIAVFRPSNSTWYIRGVGPAVYGMVDDIPVVGDYNGDGKAEIAVFRPTNSTWYIRGIGPAVYGATGDIPVVADYNGDGKAEIAVFRP